MLTHDHWIATRPDTNEMLLTIILPPGELVSVVSRKFERCYRCASSGPLWKARFDGCDIYLLRNGIVEEVWKREDEDYLPKFPPGGFTRYKPDASHRAFPGTSLPWITATTTGTMGTASAPTTTVSTTAGYTAIPKPDPDLPLVFRTDPIIGWRVWRLREQGVSHNTRTDSGDYRREWRLTSLYATQVWFPFERHRAICRPPCGVGLAHDSPWPGCLCGIWALKDDPERTMTIPLSDWPLVAGRVALWGRVVEHEKGWRGEFAYPVSLTVFSDERDSLQSTGFDPGRIYGVPTTHVPLGVSAVSDYGVSSTVKIRSTDVQP